MGLCFDDNGLYEGWSDLFNYDTIETLNASEYLPMPQKIKHIVINDAAATRQKLAQQLINTTDELRKKDIQTTLKHVDDIVDIDSDIRAINAEEDAAAKIILKVKLINKINRHAYETSKGKAVNISYTEPGGEEIVKELNIHEFTQIPSNISQDVSKNFISSHIQNTVQDLVNMTRAYSPIEISDFGDAANLSSRSKDEQGLTMLDPATKLIMQYSNMTGKNVIGIAANGEKASFMWHFYLNDLLRHGTPEQRKLGHFTFETKRIIGRANNAIQEATITGLPDLNFEGIDPFIAAEFKYRITGNLYVDLMISQVLSAATDNAKELILAKVNAGNKLAKMYLFMITLGMNINDIVKFMTSPVASFINDITEEDIFNDYNLSLDEAISFARGSFLSSEGELIIKKYPKTIMEQIKDAYESYGLDKMDKDERIADCNEFANILEGANEFSNFGRFLGLNQGIGTSKIDLQKQLSTIEKFFNDRKIAVLKTASSEEKEEIKNWKFDVKRWLKDEEYQKEIAQKYDRIKKCINIFDAFQYIPQFKAIGKLLSVVVDVDDNVSIKSRAFNAVYEKARADFNFISEDYEKKMLAAIDNSIISKFIVDQNIYIPVLKGTHYLKSDRSKGEFAEDGFLYLTDQATIASFKQIFENVIIPNLTNGVITQIDKDGNIITTEDPKLKNNPFIYNLIRSRERSVPIYKANINMNLINDNLNAQKQYQTFVQGLSQLSNYKFGSITLSDAFMLYNLIINKNKYGESRLTGLFDTFVTKNKSLHLLSKYFKFLGELDYNGVIHLDADPEFKETDAPTLDIHYKDILISAAPTVRSSKGQKDPYIIVLGDTPVIMMNSGFNKYNTIQDLLVKGTNETAEDYIERLNNDTRYFVLGSQFSDALQNKLQVIEEKKDIEQIIAYFNDFVANGLLTISKICNE